MFNDSTNCKLMNSTSEKSVQLSYIDTQMFDRRVVNDDTKFKYKHTILFLLLKVCIELQD